MYGFMHEVIVLRHSQISGAHKRIVSSNNAPWKRLPALFATPINTQARSHALDTSNLNVQIQQIMINIT